MGIFGQRRGPLKVEHLVPGIEHQILCQVLEGEDQGGGRVEPVA